MPGFEWFGDEERKEAGDVLETGVLFRYGFDNKRKGRWKVREFEQTLAKMTGAACCHLCSSGTAALSIALAACGIGGGDEVIVPPFTFIATVEAVLNAGAIPVFGEIDETLCLSPESVKRLRNDRTRAVLPVHMCGSMAQIDSLRDICNAEGLTLIEDACQSIGGTYQGKHLGTFGKMGCYSFDAVKTITCGEGGAVITNDPELYRRADAYADHGHDHIGDNRGLEGHPILGANYRISELNAAVGLAQLRKLDSIIEKQRRIKGTILEALSGNSAASFRRIPDPSGDTGTFLTLLMKDEAAARKVSADLATAGVDGCFYWYDNNWHYFRKWEHLKKLSMAGNPPLPGNMYPDYETVRLPESDAIMSRAVSMLIMLNWTNDEVNRRIDAMRKVLNV